MFSKIEGAWVILRKGGVYKVAGVYERLNSDELYAAYSGGFIALVAQKNTSVLNVTYEDLDLPSPHTAVRPVAGRVTFKRF